MKFSIRTTQDKNVFLTIALSLLVLSGCRVSEISESTPTRTLPGPTISRTRLPTPLPTITSEIIPRETILPSPTPVQQAPVIDTIPCPEYFCFWRLDQDLPQLVSLDSQFDIAYDYSPATYRLLHGNYTGQGAGPGSIAVTDLHVLDVNTGTNQQIIAQENIAEAVWAPNGQSIAYIKATSTTYELHWLTEFGENRVLAEDVAFALSVSPEGDQVAFTRESNYEVSGQPGLYVVEVNSGEERIVSDVDRAGAGSIADRPIWSPDGSQILLPVVSEAVPFGYVRAAVDGSGAAILSTSPSVKEQLAGGSFGSILLWHPDRRHLVGQIYPEMFGSEPRRIFSFELDSSLNEMVSADLIYEGEGDLMAWAEPGESIWIRNHANQLMQVPLD